VPRLEERNKGTILFRGEGGGVKKGGEKWISTRGENRNSITPDSVEEGSQKTAGVSERSRRKNKRELS